MWPSLVIAAVMIDAYLAYFLFWAMAQVTYSDRDSIRDLLFKRNGWVGKIAGGILLVFAPLTLAATILWMVIVALSVFWLIVPWPRICRLWRKLTV